MNANEVIKSSKEWLNVFDLKEKPARVKIADVELQPSRFQPGTEVFVLSFVGKEKRLGLNKTNTRSMIKLYGAETDDWLGKEITLIPTTDRNPAGEQVPCIRINEMASRTPLVPKIPVRKIFDEQNPPPQTRIPPHINSGTLEDEMNDEVPF